MPRNTQPARRPKRRKVNPDRWLLIGIIVSLLVISVLLWGPFGKSGRREPSQPAKKTEQVAKRPETTAPKPLSSKQREKAIKIAIVIDDLGQDMKSAKEIIALHPDITLAIMPGQRYSREIASLATKSNHEALLHMPMERKNHAEKPQAKGTLRSDMTPMEFMEAVAENIESVPGAVGVNNHEGSALTGNKEAMKFLMAELKARELFFLDSLTDPKSVAYATAKEFGLRAAKRDVFLDNENDNPEYIRGQLQELVRIAEKRGRAIAVGHPHPATITEIGKWLAEIEEEIEIVPASRLMQ